MLKILLLTISIFAVVFLEHLFLKIFSISLFALLGIYLWHRGMNWTYILIFVLLGLALDVTMHLPLGLHTVALGISILFAQLAKTVIPTEGFVHESIILLISTLLFYILFLVLNPVILDFSLPSISLKTVLYIVIKSLVSVLLYFFITLSTQSFRSKDFDKIRLK